MQKQNEQMPHGLPKKCPPKKEEKKAATFFLWAAVTAQVQVQDGLGHGEIEEGEKKKADFFAELLLHYISGSFLFWWQQDLNKQL